MAQPKVLLADDHSMVRKGIKQIINHQFQHAEINEAETCDELMRELFNTEYTHLVLDIIFPDGNALDVIPTIRSAFPDLNILILSMCSEDMYRKVLKPFRIFAFVNKSAPEEETTTLLRQFIANEITHPDHTGKVSSDHPFSSLSRGELQVLHYLLKGLGTKEIAVILNIKMNTVSTVKGRIFQKTKTSNLIELLELAGLFNCYYFL